MPDRNITDLLADLNHLHNDLENFRRRLQIFCAKHPEIATRGIRSLDISLPDIDPQTYPPKTEHKTHRS